MRGRVLLWLLPLALVYLLPGLVGHDPWKQDEGYTFGLVLHILETGDWIVPTLAGQPFMEKPPLFYVSAAIVATLLQSWLPLHDGARVAAMLWIVVGLAATAAAAARLHGRDAAVRTTLLLMGSIGLVVHAHEMITDTALFAGFAVAVLGLAGVGRPDVSPIRAGALLGIGVGIGFLAKGLVEPVMIGLCCVGLVSASARWRTRDCLRAFGWAALFALPWLSIWPVALYSANREAFDTWFWVNNVGRFTGTAHLGADSETLYYARLLPWFALPSGPLALVVLVRAWRQRRVVGEHQNCAGLVQAVIVTAAIIAVLSCAATVRSLYALPLLIPLALIAGRDPLPTGRALAVVSAAFGIFCASIALLLWWLWASSLALGHPPRWEWLLRWLPEGYRIELDPTLIAVAAAVAVAFGACWVARPSPLCHAQRWVAGVALVWGTVMSLHLPWIDHAKSFRQTFVQLANHLPDNECAIESGLGEPQRGMLHYVAALVATSVDHDDGECGFLIVQVNHRADLPAALHRPGWYPVWTGHRPGELDEAFALFERQDALFDPTHYANEGLQAFAEFLE